MPNDTRYIIGAIANRLAELWYSEQCRDVQGKYYLFHRQVQAGELIAVPVIAKEAPGADYEHSMPNCMSIGWTVTAASQRIAEVMRGLPILGADLVLEKATMTDDEIAGAILRARTQAPKEQPGTQNAARADCYRIRAIDWKKRDTGWTAKTPFGQYVVLDTGEHYEGFTAWYDSAGSSEPLGQFRTAASAKSRCDQHWKSTILEALEPAVIAG